MSELLKTREIVGLLTAPDGEYPVENSPIGGVDYPVFKTAPPCLPALFQMCLQHGDADFIVCGEDRFSYLEMYAAAGRLAHFLCDRGIEPGDRVAIAMRNRPEWVMAYMGILMAGAVVVPMNSWWTGAELDYGLEDSGARFVFTDRSLQERLAQTSNSTPRLSAGEFGERDNEFMKAISGFPGTPPAFDSIRPEDDASIMYTSGSTGHPKGAVSTHQAIISALMCWAVTAISIKVFDGTLDEVPEYQPGILATLPLFHVTGCHGQFLLSILFGRKVVLMYRWQAEAAARLIEEEKLNNFSGVPTMSLELMDIALNGQYDLSTLQDMMAGGAARPPDQVERLQSTFPNAQPAAGYGLTETNGLGTLNGLTDYIAKPASAGIVSQPTVQLEIRDETGRSLPPGQAGEICIKSPSNIPAYWNRPAETRDAFMEGGWLKTGDVGYLDEEDFLFIVDRIKDIVVRGGENISCLEVEAAISAHPAVREASVFSVPHDRLGETAACLLFADSAESLTAELVQGWLNGKLASFKIPEFIYIIDGKLPRLASGKIDKRASRKLLLENFEISL
jgi:acyl-CoA synthetase (AMP-forming)/AMP-acid ligase II